MTREKAIELIGSMKGDLSDFFDYDDLAALDMAISALSAEPCEDAVSREEVSRWYCNTTCNMDYCTEPCLEHKELMLLPSVQPKKEITQWIYSDLLRVKHGTMSIDSLIDKVWCRER